MYVIQYDAALNDKKKMMNIALEKRRNGKIEKVWSLDGKNIKTSPSGSPREMYSKEDKNCKKVNNFTI